MLLTTHYLDEAQALADRVAIVKDGRILAEGRRASSAPGRRAYRVAYRASDGELVALDTDDPTTLLHELTGAALAARRAPRGAVRARPTLEDVYLELTADD